MPARCDSLPTPADTVFRSLFITLEAPMRPDTLPPAYVGLVMDALVHAFVVPRPLVMPAFVMGQGAAGDSSPRWKTMPAAIGEMTFTLDTLGTPSDVHLTQSSLSPSLDNALLAMSRPDSAHPFPAPTGVTGPKPVRFFVAFHSGDTGKTQPIVMPVKTNATGLAATPAARAPLVRVRVPRWDDGRFAAPLPDNPVKATYPVVGLRGRIDDDVMVQFVIDEAGYPIPSTIRLVSAHYREFAQSAVEALTKARFRPGSIGQCAVREIVQQPFAFKMRPP
jgi:TonB family protein